MRRILQVFVAQVIALSLAGCGNANTDGSTNSDSNATAVVSEAVKNAAPSAFAICKSCHAVEKGKTVVGPSLYAIVGAKAGAAEGYSSSPAIRASGLVWDDATLDAFLTSPMKKVPGTRMTYAGQSNPAKRAEIIAYLKTLNK